MTGKFATAAAAGGVVFGALLLSACDQADDGRVPDAANATFIIDGDVFALKEGRAARHDLPGSAMINKLYLAEKPVYVDFDGDGALDSAVHLINDPGGSGAFHYVAIVMNRGKRDRETNVLFLGDRIEGVEMTKNGASVRIDYRDRPTSQSYGEEARVGKTLWLRFDLKQERAVLEAMQAPIRR